MIKENEYGTFYAGYIRLSDGMDLAGQLRAQKVEVLTLMAHLTEKESLYRYGEGKWSLKQVFGHLTDTERIFCYRALAVARGEENPLPGYDQDRYVDGAGFDAQSLESLAGQYRTVREATLELFSAFSDEELLRKGVVSDSPCSVRALGYIIAGHEQHHLNIIAERYLPGITEE